MMPEEHVSQKLCDDRNGNTVKRLDKHEEEIEDLKAAVIKLTQIVDNLSKAAAVKFYQTKEFSLLIKTGCILIVLITMAAIGMNYFKEYLAVLK